MSEAEQRAALAVYQTMANVRTIVDHCALVSTGYCAQMLNAIVRSASSAGVKRLGAQRTYEILQRAADDVGVSLLEADAQAAQKDKQP